MSRRIESNILRHKNCKGLVVISYALKRRYRELFPFFPEDKITVLHDAADIDLSESGEKAELLANESDIKIGYVGSLFPGKCMETLLPLAQICPQYKFHIVGGSKYWVDYWKNKANLIRVDNLIFYGFVDNSMLSDYYRAFDLCILPFSRNIHIDKKAFKW